MIHNLKHFLVLEIFKTTFFLFLINSTILDNKWKIGRDVFELFLRPYWYSDKSLIEQNQLIIDK